MIEEAIKYIDELHATLFQRLKAQHRGILAAAAAANNASGEYQSKKHTCESHSSNRCVRQGQQVSNVEHFGGGNTHTHSHIHRYTYMNRREPKEGGESRGKTATDGGPPSSCWKRIRESSPTHDPKGRYAVLIRKSLQLIWKEVACGFPSIPLLIPPLKQTGLW